VDTDVTKLISASRANLGAPDSWPAIVGYPESLALCVIDAIQSTGPTYVSVVNVLSRYRNYRTAAGANPETDGLKELISTFDQLGGVDGWIETIGNRNRTFSRAHAPYKAEAIWDAAGRLQALGIDTIQDFRAAVANPAQADVVERTWRTVVSQASGVTWSYVLMLAGHDGVKTDRMIVRFVAAAVGRRVADVTNAEAGRLVREAAAELGVPASTLDHAIWRYQSGAARNPDVAGDARDWDPNDEDLIRSEDGSELEVEPHSERAPTLGYLTDRLAEFARRRDWEKFHHPKNLLLALTGELGELATLFQWESDEASRDMSDPGRRSLVEDELADVFIYLLRLADVLGVDLAKVAEAKIDRNEHRFPPPAPN